MPKRGCGHRTGHYHLEIAGLIREIDGRLRARGLDHRPAKVGMPAQNESRFHARREKHMMRPACPAVCEIR